MARTIRAWLIVQEVFFIAAMNCASLDGGAAE
jgi:hypothetical protein